MSTKPSISMIEPGPYVAVTGSKILSHADQGAVQNSVSGTPEITLPDAATVGSGWPVRIRHGGSNTTVVPTGSDTVEMGLNAVLTSIQLSTRGDFINLTSTGIGWVAEGIIASADPGIDYTQFEFSGHLTSELDSDITPLYLTRKATFPFEIDALIHHIGTGAVAISVQINGVDVTGLVALSTTTTETEATSTAQNAVAAGDVVTMVFSGMTSGDKNFSFTLQCTRT